MWFGAVDDVGVSRGRGGLEACGLVGGSWPGGRWDLHSGGCPGGEVVRQLGVDRSPGKKDILSLSCLTTFIRELSVTVIIKSNTNIFPKLKSKCEK